jgi:S-formylglutathione hydrolase FrmB
MPLAKKEKVQILLVLLLSASALIAQPLVRLDSLFSPSVGKTMRYTVIIPQNYDPHRQYPLLYLLHGYGGGHTDWTARTKLLTYLSDIPLIVVMPDAGNSWYLNSPVRTSQRFEDYIVNDLRDHLVQRYSVDSTRQAIAGLSMGSYGAVMLALRHPQQFRFAGSLSGALSFSREVTDSSSQVGKLAAASFRSLYADSSVAKLRAMQSAYDIFQLVQTSHDTLPYFYLVMGTADGYREFLPSHRDFTALLRSWHIPYEYHETPGVHNWLYWDREIQPLLVRLRAVLHF